MEVARSKNIVPLPPAKPHCGIRLPPDRYCLSACNYKLKPAKKTVTKSIASAASGPRMASALTATRAVVRPNSPAVRVQVPRPVMKLNTGTVPGPKIQISVPSQPTPSAVQVQVAPAPQFTVIKEELIEEPRGVKREREDDDYDAP
jgi:transcription initiation factor TFIID subunit 9B